MASNKWKKEHKEDMLRYSREWYQRNKQSVIDRQHQRRKETQEWLTELKGKLKCETCGMSHVACLHFHHTDPSKKEKSISKAVRGGWGKKRILEEMKKCKVLCANCHSIHHWED